MQAQRTKLDTTHTKMTEHGTRTQNQNTDRLIVYFIAGAISSTNPSAIKLLLFGRLILKMPVCRSRLRLTGAGWGFGKGNGQPGFEIDKKERNSECCWAYGIREERSADIGKASGVDVKCEFDHLGIGGGISSVKVGKLTSFLDLLCQGEHRLPVG